MKNIFIGIISGIILLFLLGFGLKSMVQNIYHTKDCERFHIDHVELRTGINIPNIKDVTCECSEEERNSSFILDFKSRAELEEYIQKNAFELKDELYVKKGENKNTIWNSSLNPNSHELTVHLIYTEG